MLRAAVERRHLSSSQRAALAVVIERRLAADAADRKRANGGDRRGPSAAPGSGVGIFPPPVGAGNARDQAAAATGTNPRYVSDAKRIAEQAPELLARVKAGELTIPQAKAELRRQAGPGDDGAGDEPAAQTDELGRPVPPELAAVFESRTWFRRQSQLVGRMLRDIGEVARQPHGAALAAAANAIDQYFRNGSSAVAGGMPYAVCHDWQEGTDEHPADCPLCSVRGWVARLRFGQLPAGKRAAARRWRAGRGVG